MLKLPKSYRPSKKIEPDEGFEVIAEVRRKEDGSFYLSKVDGQEVGDEDEKEDERSEEMEDEPSFDAMVAVPVDNLKA